MSAPTPALLVAVGIGLMLPVMGVSLAAFVLVDALVERIRGARR